MCGGADFVSEENQAPNQPNYNQTWQPPVPQDQPKKKKMGLVIGIIAAVLIVLAGVGMLAEKVFQEQDNENDAWWDEPMINCWPEPVDSGYNYDIYDDTK